VVTLTEETVTCELPEGWAASANVYVPPDRLAYDTARVFKVVEVLRRAGEALRSIEGELHW
jgi:hypothetical protein